MSLIRTHTAQAGLVSFDLLCEDAREGERGGAADADDTDNASRVNIAGADDDNRSRTHSQVTSHLEDDEGHSDTDNPEVVVRFQVCTVA